MSQGLVKKAIYYHYDECTETSDKNEIIKQEVVDPLLIDALNLGCAKIRENISSATYPVVLKREAKCIGWFKENNQNLRDLKEKYACR